MGQGYSIIHPQAGSAGIDTPELVDLEYERTLNGAKFLKVIRARHKDGVVIVKVFTKAYAALKLDDRVKALIEERRALADVPNALPFHRILETHSNGYLVRQFVHHSLYDRISTNPPLEDIERKWIAFQLLCAVRDCHARNVYHGDIKSENMLLTSWNWLYLADFAGSLKPHFLPEDNPVEYTIYYDTTARRVCYIAPERFISTSDVAENTDNGRQLDWAMDMFSVGCVIAELFTEKPTFTLTQLLRYRKGDFDPAHTLSNSIKDDGIRDLILQCLRLDPSARMNAEDTLASCQETNVFPLYFYNFLHQYTQVLTDPTSGRKPVVVEKTNSGVSDERIDHIYNDFDKISYALGFDTDRQPNEDDALLPRCLRTDLFPLQVDIPNNRHPAMDRAGLASDNGALLFSNIVISSLRSMARASSRVRGCELLLAFAEHLTDEAKLDRVLPYAIALLEDEVDTVKIAALRTITQLLALVNALSPMNAFIFPRYILPRLQKFISGPTFARSSPVRATYAKCLATLAHTAAKYLDMTQALRADGSLPSTDPEAEDDVAAYAAYQTSYDLTREELVQQFEAQTKLFLTDEDPAVQRAFLSSVGGLCVFFGDRLASDLILTHLNTYLNDPDWTLKCAFFETIVGVAAFIGGPSLEEFILPLLVQALTDAEETVTEQAIRALSSMARLGLFQRWVVLELVLIVTRFTLHPNHWIREAAAQFISLAVTHLSEADVISLINPLIKPVLKIDSADTAELNLLDSLKKPIPRSAVDMAKMWAAKADKSNFWKPAQNAKSFSFDASSNKSLMDLYRGSEDRGLGRQLHEDEQWLTRMRNAGMKSEDEVKLVALRDYIWRHVLRSEKESAEATISPYNHVVSLTSLKVPLQNVLFDDDMRYYDQIMQNNDQGAKAQPTSLAEALSEAALSRDKENGQSHTAGKNGVVGLRSSVPTERRVSESESEPSRAPSVVAKTADGKLAVQQDHAALSEQLSASPSSQISTSSQRNQHTLRPKASAVNLMKRVEMGSKATAEIGTDSMTAQGKLDVPHSARATPISTPMPAPTPKMQGHHSYNGTDPTIGKFLNNMYTSNYPVDLAEFGPIVQSIQKGPILTSTNQTASGRWRPQKQLVAAISEHTNNVTALAVAPDHTFFISGSEDGSVRVWDSSRLERNITHRSRHLHKHASDAAITCLTFVESTHCFISAATDGTLNVIKIDLSESAGSIRYGKLQVLRDWRIPGAEDSKEHAVSIEHYRHEGESICMLLTSTCRILAVDLRDMSIVFELNNPVEHGTPLSFCVNRRKQWLMIGTSHGVLDLWDLRFRLRLRSWTFRNPAPIWQISMHPGRRTQHKMRVCISGGTATDHVSVWDLEKLACAEIFHSSDDASARKISSKDLELVTVDDEKNESQISHVIGVDSLAQPAGKAGIASAVRSFVMRMHIPDESNDTSDARHAFLLTAGPDWKVRFWDPARLSNSMVVNGTEAHDNNVEFSASLVGADTKVYSETSNKDTAALEDKASPSPSRGSKTSSTRASKTQAKSSGAGRSSRYDTIRNSAQSLLKGHKNDVTCVAMIERPFGMVISADRSGMIYIFQ